MKSQQKNSDGVTDIALCPGKMRGGKEGPEELSEQEGDAQHHTYLSLTPWD